MKTNGANIPIIGSTKVMDMEPFALDGLGWFDPDETITPVHVSHLLIILITLIMPKPQNVVFRIREYAEEHDLVKFFKTEAPASVKQLQKDLKEAEAAPKIIDAGTGKMNS